MRTWYTGHDIPHGHRRCVVRLPQRAHIFDIMSVAPMPAEKNRQTQRRASAQIVAKAVGITDFGDDAIGAIMKMYDTNGDGNFSIDEVRDIVHDVQSQKSKVKMLKSFVAILTLLVIVAFGAIFGVSLAAAEASKESHVTGGVMTSTTGVPVATSPVESFSDSIFDLPQAPADQLLDLQTLMAFVDFSGAADPFFAGTSAAATSFQVTGSFKLSATQLVLTTASGGMIKIDSVARTASMRIAGGEYPLYETLPEARARALMLEAEPLPTYSAAEQLEDKRRKLRICRRRRGCPPPSGARFTGAEGGGSQGAEVATDDGGW